MGKQPARRLVEHVEHPFKAVAPAEVGVGHVGIGIPFAEGEEFAHPGPISVGAGVVKHIVQVCRIHHENVIELIEILRSELPRPESRNIYSPPQ